MGASVLARAFRKIVTAYVGTAALGCPAERSYDVFVSLLKICRAFLDQDSRERLSPRGFGSGTSGTLAPT